ncbi:unnamed protein product [Thelazia callipaeda]|uniref:Mitochondrial import receptor subunit TOM20 homolog n=1 Tax=Thelazia callipaeda TaxID=103827 RepID=A0A0N5DB55_THECL|nr:unnamed protein product [Thelazia callipaeda]
MRLISFFANVFTRERIVVVAGVATAAFISYCIYFDHKRRSAIDYKQKIREQRRAASKKKEPKSFPNPRNASEIQAFFLQEVQLGEELLSDGHVDQGVEHLCNAITLCGQPSQLIQIFQQTLSSEQFNILVQKLPEAKARLMQMFGDRLNQDDVPLAEGSDTPGQSGLGVEISDDLDLA